MHQLRRILEHVVDGFNDIPFSEHDFVPHGHESVLHVRPDSGYQVYAVLKEHIEELWRDVSSPDFVTQKSVNLYLIETQYFVTLCHPF